MVSAAVPHIIQSNKKKSVQPYDDDDGIVLVSTHTHPITHYVSYNEMVDFYNLQFVSRIQCLQYILLYIYLIVF